jgi:alpha-ketoglutarate-dependent taurine dioxygenase
MHATELAHFRVSELTPAFGAEVTGLDSPRRLEPDQQRELRALLDRYGVLVFRDLELDREAQQYLAQVAIGDDDLSDDSIRVNAASQDSFYISNKIEGAAAPYGVLLYHADGMWSEHPFHVISLWGEDVQPPVPPTLFASTTHALTTMPAALRARLEGHQAVHVPGPESFKHRKLNGTEGTLVMPKRDRDHSVVQPVLFRHPRTGEEFVYASQQMTSHIVDMAPAASEALLDELFAHLYSTENTLQHEWRQGDLVMWDNLATQHARPEVELDSSTRTLRKVGWPLPPVPGEHNVLEYEAIN